MAASSFLPASARPHDPDNVGFMHTYEQQFTYFSGSEAGARDTFGLSPAELLKLMMTFTQKIMKLEGDVAPEAILQKIQETHKNINELAHEKDLYSDMGRLCDEIKKYGHIPLIIKGAAPAAQFGRAVRSIHSLELREYFMKIAGSQKQAYEYVVKQDMMKAIAILRENIRTQRQTLTEEEVSFYSCNRILHALENDVIIPNQESLPQECIQFDLYHEFLRKLRHSVCRIDRDIVGKEFLEALHAWVSMAPNHDHPVDAQKALSDSLYEEIKAYLGKHGVAKGKELDLSDKLDAILQQLLPVVAYLNCEYNPFARDGLFGEIVTNPFQEIALAAYRKHESKEIPMFSSFRRYYKKTTGSEYNGEQIEKLLYGTGEEAPKPKETKGFFGSISSTLAGMLGDGSASSSSHKISHSKIRRRKLALPAPAMLLLKAPETDIKPTPMK